MAPAPDRKAVLFDLDGTLLDTLEDIADSVNATLSEFGYPSHELAFYKTGVGPGADDLILQSLPQRHRDEETAKRCLARFLSEYEARWHRKTRPYPGIPGLLDELTARGIDMAILSNKPDSFTKKVVDRFLNRRHFQIVMGASEDFPLKPDPSSAIEISRRMGIPARDFFYVGDSGIDMRTAVAAHMKPIGVLWGFRGREELATDGAAAIIGHPSELLDLIAPTA